MVCCLSLSCLVLSSVVMCCVVILYYATIAMTCFDIFIFHQHCQSIIFIEVSEFQTSISISSISSCFFVFFFYFFFYSFIFLFFFYLSLFFSPPSFQYVFQISYVALNNPHFQTKLYTLVKNLLKIFFLNRKF